MEAKFSEGPWHVEPEEASDHHGLVICAADAIVATITPEEHGPDLDEIDRANARLIAAAPDLLAALHLAFQWLTNVRLENPDLLLNTQPSGRRGMNQIREALAKARGGE